MAACGGIEKSRQAGRLGVDASMRRVFVGACASIRHYARVNRTGYGVRPVFETRSYDKRIRYSCGRLDWVTLDTPNPAHAMARQGGSKASRRPSPTVERQYDDADQRPRHDPHPPGGQHPGFGVFQHVAQAGIRRRHAQTDVAQRTRSRMVIFRDDQRGRHDDRRQRALGSRWWRIRRRRLTAWATACSRASSARNSAPALAGRHPSTEKAENHDQVPDAGVQDGIQRQKQDEAGHRQEDIHDPA